MKIIPSKTYKPLFEGKTRYYLLCGGRGAGRSYAGSQRAILDTISKPYSRIIVMRYVLGDVRASIWSDVKDRIEEYGLPDVRADQQMKYEYKGNTIEGKGFKKSSSQNKAKLKSLAGVNTVIIEEADEVEEEDFNKLDASIRTKKGENHIILMFNFPEKNHWIIRRWFNLIDSDVKGYYVPQAKQRKDTTYIIDDYHSNIKNLSSSAVNVLEGYKEHSLELYYTMVKGYVSEGKQGRVFKDWEPITEKEYSKLPYTPIYGLDFGYSNDPAALVEVKKHNNKLYVKEMFYELGLTNTDISSKLHSLGIDGEIVADSAEPKSIEELIRLGHTVKPSVKGADSIRSGIDRIKALEVFYVETSENLKAEIQNYVYKLDQNKMPTNQPIDKHNHLMDAIRYSMLLLGRENRNHTMLFYQ